MWLGHARFPLNGRIHIFNLKIQAWRKCYRNNRFWMETVLSRGATCILHVSRISSTSWHDVPAWIFAMRHLRPPSPCPPRLPLFAYNSSQIHREECWRRRALPSKSRGLRPKLTPGRPIDEADSVKGRSVYRPPGLGRGVHKRRGGKEEVPWKVQRFYSSWSFLSVCLPGFTSSEKICRFL